MKHFPLLALLGLTILLPPVQGFFLGPVAVGAALGALFLTKGLIIGTALASRRTRQQSQYRSRRSHQPYRKQHHYQTSYNTGYSQPTAYYYSSAPRRSRRYVKREAFRLAADPEMLARVRREVQQSWDSGAWFLEMVEKDQDDCTKRLICEMAARNASGPLTGVEADLSQAFGLDNFIDISSSKAVFDMAAQTGKLMGKKRCEDFYKRCKTPVDDILEMINKEVEDMTKLEEEVMKEADPLAVVERLSEEERLELAKELHVDLNN